jgi:hypothetical protein
MPYRFYRIVGTNPPGEIDFSSNKAKGLPPRGPELVDPELHDDISVWDSREGAVRTVRRYPKIGAFIAELVIPDDATVRFRQTGDPGHYSIWAEPQDLLALVTGVSPA